MNTFRLLGSLLAATLLFTQPADAQVENFFIGQQAGANNITGNRNTFVGTFTGFSNRSGSDNAFFGHSSGFNNSTGSSNAFFGRSAGLSNFTGSSNTFVGSSAGRRSTSGIENTFIGSTAGENNFTGNGNSYFGFRAGILSSQTNLTNATAIGHRAIVSRSNALVLGSIAGKNGATSDVNVGIGVDAPTFQLHLSKNSAAKPGSSSWTVASDGRLKKDVQAFTDGLNVLLKVNPVKYYYNGKAQMPTEKEYVGVIAQEIKKVAPYMVDEFLYENTTGQEEKYLNYDASALTYILVNSVKEQQKIIQAMQAENQELKQQMGQIIAVVAKLPGHLTEVNGSTARLWQNAPNPTDRTTVIKYWVPSSATFAAITLFNSNGQQVSSYHLKTGEGEITLPTGTLAAGTYVYALLVDGVQIESKKLVVLK
ncbi:hypothetical protein AHMF7605_16420 [Adhaeribacter arboris]|uniref:Peptidase S74 domain-containing protein n=1 Tax=Adhaeribacter arboris TaxID=2072846 RepID=A0A2T2YHI8_9BACT|nr:tail fiber domain-containing protein [Adhaeribacter arboris]PSR54974.1 hypothetical protein AHMF7605_16420 [Adhaeribacter arboris]